MKAFEKEFEQVGFTASLLAVDLYNLEFVSAAINQELGQARSRASYDCQRTRASDPGGAS